MSFTRSVDNFCSRNRVWSSSDNFIELDHKNNFKKIHITIFQKYFLKNVGFDGIGTTKNVISPDYASSTPIWTKWVTILFLELMDQGCFPSLYLLSV